MNDSEKKFGHQTVLLKELVDGLQLSPGDTAIDCTAGGGGHTALLLEHVGAEGKVYAFDRDESAIAFLKDRFARELARENLVLVNKAFSEIGTLEVSDVAGICADIGVSSPQLDLAERGFSFMREGPLDMRMDQSSDISAADIINGYGEKELADLIYKYGEEPKSRIIARKIVERRKERPFETTLDLAKFIEDNIFYKGKSRTHKATRTFQALRIAVNEELTELERLIDDGFPLLKPGGHFAIISFHSLEDRIIKHRFRALSGKLPKPDREMRHLPVEPPPVHASVIKPFPFIPTDEEQKNNPRARSAKLRVIKKC